MATCGRAGEGYPATHVTHTIPKPSWEVYVGLAARFFYCTNPTPVNERITDAYGLKCFAQKTAEKLSVASDLWWSATGVSMLDVLYRNETGDWSANSQVYKQEMFDVWNRHVAKIWGGHGMRLFWGAFNHGTTEFIGTGNPIDAWNNWYGLDPNGVPDRSPSLWRHSGFARVTPELMMQHMVGELDLDTKVVDLSDYLEGPSDMPVINKANEALKWRFNISQLDMLKPAFRRMAWMISQSNWWTPDD